MDNYSGYCFNHIGGIRIFYLAGDYQYDDAKGRS